MKDQNPDQKIVTTNRKALFDYFIIETYEAGIALKGTEVKSLRLGNANLQDSYAAIVKGEVWLIGLHINPSEQGNVNNHEPRRERKLLMHRQEIRRLASKLSEKGLTLVPLKLYFTKKNVKVELGLGKGKKQFDKRETIKAREVDRELRRKMHR